MGSYQGVGFAVPTDTQGLLTERPKSASRAQLLEGSLARKIQMGAASIRMEAEGAGHRGIFAQSVRAPVIEGVAADFRKQELDEYYQREIRKKKGLRAQGEANMRLPNRASFSGEEKFRRGDSVVHNAGHRRGVVLGPSRSKPGLLKIVVDGQVYRVSPGNLSRL